MFFKKKEPFSPYYLRGSSLASLAVTAELTMWQNEKTAVFIFLPISFRLRVHI